MAKTAMTELTDQIEAIRREAYNDGYAAAMRAVVEYSTSRTAIPKATATKATVTKAPVTTANAAKSTTATTAAPKRQRRAQAKPAGRYHHGDNARHIAEAMMTLPDHRGPAAAIKRALAKKGHEIAYASIRNALAQLQARGAASVATDGKTWSYIASAE